VEIQLSGVRNEYEVLLLKFDESVKKNHTSLTENHQLEQRIEEYKRELSREKDSKRSVIDKYEERLKKQEDELIGSLKRDLIRVEGEKNLLRRDFDFYKRHANAMLQREKDVNARIRTVLDCTKCGGSTPEG